MELFEYIDKIDKPYDIFYSTSTSSAMHWHYYCEILYMRSGKMCLKCNDYSFELVEGDICYIYPLQLHETQKIEGNKADYAVIKFDIHTINIPDAYIQKMYDYFVTRTSEQDYCLIVKNAEKISDTIANIVDEYNSNEELHSFKMQSDIFSTLIYIARMCDKKLPQIKEKQSDSSLSFYRILEYIDLHSEEQIDVQELAEKCHLSYSHFARLFRENYGRSCKEYITYIRLNKADELLMHTNYDISYIAAKTGFFDSSHLIKTYKRWKGITPKQQRMLYAKSISYIETC